MPRASMILGGAFPLYSAEHWAALAAIAGVTTSLCYLLRRTRHDESAPAVRRIICWGLAAVLLGGVGVAHIQRITAGVWSLAESLPLHLCDITVLVVAATLIGVGRNGPAAPRGARLQRLYELAYTWALGGTLQAVLTPDVQTRFPSSDCIRYFVLHGGIIVGVLVMTIGLRMRPQPGTPTRVWLTTVGLALLVLPIDWALGANYMYLCGPPANPTLYDLFGRWPWSLLTLLVVGTALIYVCYLPFWLWDRAKSR